MLLSKKKIKVNNLAALLYISTIDANQLNKLFEKIDNIKSPDRSEISRELIILRLITVCYLLCSNKIFKSNPEKVTSLHLEYLEHFESDEFQYEGKVPFVDLLERRMKIYRPLLENDCTKCAAEIAQIFADNCDVKDSDILLDAVRNYYLDSLFYFSGLLSHYKLI